MTINWHGLGSFTITGKVGQADVTIVTNPFTDAGSLKLPRNLSASLVVSSHDGKDANAFSDVSSEYPENRAEPFVVTHAGEFEVGGAAVTGVMANKKNGTSHTIYRIDVESMSVGFLGALDRQLTDKEIEDLGPIDILIIPAGGGEVLSASAAAELVAAIEPRLVIPSYCDDATAFVREVGGPTENTSKLKISRSGLPEEDMKIVTLTH